MKPALNPHRALRTVVFLMLLFLAACGESTTPQPKPISIQQIAENITKDVGTVTQISEKGDPHRKVIVFEEDHSSRAGQIEIAVMLNRLYENYGLRNIGLEGAFVGETITAPPWLQSHPSFKAKQPISHREDVIAQLLEDGAISSSEFMALVYQDMNVVGIEDSNEYNGDTLTSDAADSVYIYLYEIALQGMTPDQQTACANQPNDQVFDCVIATDSWAEGIEKQIQDPTLSSETWLQILDEVKSKADSIVPSGDLTADDQANFQALQNFYEGASQRSQTMETHTLDLLRKSSNWLVAMTIGAAHADEVAQLLTNANVSFVVIEGNSLAHNLQNGDLSDQAYSRKASSPPLSVDPPGTLGSFLDGGTKKPRPVVDQPWFQAKAQVFLLVDYLAHRVADGMTQLTTGEISNLPKTPQVTLNPDSFVRDNDTAIFSITARDQNNAPVTLWVRAGVVVAKKDTELLEQRLLEAYQRVQNAPAPSSAPEVAVPVSTPKEILISKDTDALFSTDKNAILNTDLKGR
jgi:hypothetical protein